MNNYEYCAVFAQQKFPERTARILDYGCGAGEIVSILRAHGFDAHGCDVFYDGGSYQSRVPAEFYGTIIKSMNGDTIPFGDDEFDLVISNQVLEHVPDLDVVLSEVHRVVKPGGLVLSLFPDVAVWREGHCGIPFLHWFPRGKSRIRLAYAFTLRCCGLGFFKNDKARSAWARDFCAWLDTWCHYRSYAEIRRQFGGHFGPLEHLEPSYLDLRLPAATALPAFLKSMVVRKLAGNVFVCSKHLEPAPN